jgi:hypothetical protein
VAGTIVFNDVLPGAKRIVLLAEGTAYRVEIEPASARVTIRHNRHPGQDPLFLLPVDVPVPGGAAYQLIPRQSAEYRIDVVVTGGDVVRVRIVTDPQETARWASVRESTEGRMHGDIALRAVYLGPFPAIHVTPAGDSLTYVAGAGADFCLGVVPRGAWLSGSFGGCAAHLTLVNRGTDGNAVFASLAPRWMVTPEGATTQLSLVGYVGVGTTTVNRNIGFTLFGLGGMVERPLFGSRYIGLEAEGGLWLLSATGGLSSGGESAAHLALGVHALF